MLAKRSNALKSPRARPVQSELYNAKFAAFFIFPLDPDASTRRRPAISTLYTTPLLATAYSRELPLTRRSVRLLRQTSGEILRFPTELSWTARKIDIFFLLFHVRGETAVKKALSTYFERHFFFLSFPSLSPSCQYFILKLSNRFIYVN